MQELDNFRKKYPDYNDLSDSDLAGMLAKKYPDAYGDLTAKITTKESEKMGPTFLVPPEGETKLSQERPIRKIASDIYTPVLEGIGFVGGAIAGGAAGAPTGAGAMATGALAAGTGYAIGKSTARRIDEVTGLRKPQTMGEAAVESGKDILSGTAMEMGGQVAGKYVIEPMVASAAQKLSKVIRTGMEKGVKPTTVGRRTITQDNDYFERAESGVKSIIVNKDSLKLTDKNGDIITGKLPKSLKQFGEAIDQTKKNIFQQYDAMQAAAGEEGAVIDLAPIAKELLSIADDGVIKTEAPGIAAYARKKAEKYLAKGKYTPSEAQDAIKLINEELMAFYKNPKYSFSGRKSVDDLAVNHLRKSLDDVIEKTTGEGGYQELKNAYGSLRAIEDGVNKRAGYDARKNKIGFFGYADIWTAAEVVSAISDPTKLPRAAAIQGMRQWIRWFENPNRIVKNMFSESEALMSRLPKRVREQVVEEIKKEAGVYRYAPEFKGTKSVRPNPLRTELQPGEPEMIIPQKEGLFPDQLSRVQQGKSLLSRTIEEESRIGRPLIRRNFTPGSYR